MTSLLQFLGAVTLIVLLVCGMFVVHWMLWELYVALAEVIIDIRVAWHFREFRCWHVPMIPVVIMKVWCINLFYGHCGELHYACGTWTAPTSMLSLGRMDWREPT